MGRPRQPGRGEARRRQQQAALGEAGAGHDEKLGQDLQRVRQPAGTAQPPQRMLVNADVEAETADIDDPGEVHEFLLDLARPGRSLADAILQERGRHVHDIGSVPGIGQRGEERSDGVGAVQGDQDGEALHEPLERARQLVGGECRGGRVIQRRERGQQIPAEGGLVAVSAGKDHGVLPGSDASTQHPRAGPGRPPAARNAGEDLPARRGVRKPGWRLRWDGEMCPTERQEA